MWGLLDGWTFTGELMNEDHNKSRQLSARRLQAVSATKSHERKEASQLALEQRRAKMAQNKALLHCDKWGVQLHARWLLGTREEYNKMSTAMIVSSSMLFRPNKAEFFTCPSLTCFLSIFLDHIMSDIHISGDQALVHKIAVMLYSTSLTAQIGRGSQVCKIKMERRRTNIW